MKTLTGYYSQGLWKHKNHLQLATQTLACASQLHVPAVTQGLPLSFVMCRQRYPTISRYHYPCREQRAAPVSGPHPPRQCLISLLLPPIILCYIWQIMAVWGKQNFFFFFFFKTGKPLWRKRPMIFLVAEERARLQDEPWGLRESSQEQDIATALTSGHFQGLIMGNRVIQALVFAQLWSIKM